VFVVETVADIGIVPVVVALLCIFIGFGMFSLFTSDSRCSLLIVGCKLLELVLVGTCLLEFVPLVVIELLLASLKLFKLGNCCWTASLAFLFIWFASVLFGLALLSTSCVFGLWDVVRTILF
jgi:hypothetical protein